MGLNGTLVEAKISVLVGPLNVRFFSFNKFPILRPTTVQMSNLALIETKRIAVQLIVSLHNTDPPPQKKKYTRSTNMTCPEAEFMKVQFR
jgi:hypothetical protein